MFVSVNVRVKVDSQVLIFGWILRVPNHVVNLPLGVVWGAIGPSDGDSSAYVRCSVSGELNAQVTHKTKLCSSTGAP